MLCESEQKHIYVEVYRVRVDSCLENGHSSGELVELATLVSFPFSFHLLFVDRLARDFLVFRNVIPRRWQRRWIFSRREYYRCINVSYQFKRCWSRGVALPFHSAITFLKYIRERNENKEKARSTFRRDDLRHPFTDFPTDLYHFPFVWNEISTGLARISNGEKILTRTTGRYSSYESVETFSTIRYPVRSESSRLVKIHPRIRDSANLHIR